MTPAVKHPGPSITLSVLSVFTLECVTRAQEIQEEVNPERAAISPQSEEINLWPCAPEITFHFAGALLHQGCLTSENV